MTKLNIGLSALLVVCGLGLVTSQHRARNLFVDLERANNRTREFEVRWEQLQVEQTGLASASLIDAKARRGLGMQSVLPQRTIHLNLGAAAGGNGGDRPSTEVGR